LILEELRQKWYRRVLEHNLESNPVSIEMFPLKPTEAIGKPSRIGYPLIEGKEVIIQASLAGSIGHAFTDAPSEYTGTLSELRAMSLDTNIARARLVAAANATYRFLGLIGETRHCRDDGPELCAAKMALQLAQKHSSDSRVTIVGFQPAIAHYISEEFDHVRITDMNPTDIGKMINGITVESGEYNSAAIKSSDLVLATGSTLTNASIDDIIQCSSGKTLYFYGVTIAAAAYEFNLKRLCFEAG
jgi:uncharacterized protein (DUF4213/DUF364 family)